MLTSSERDGDVEVTRDQIRRKLGRTDGTEPTRASKSRVEVDVQLSDAIVVNVVNRSRYKYTELYSPIQRLSSTFGGPRVLRPPISIGRIGTGHKSSMILVLSIIRI